MSQAIPDYSNGLADLKHYMGDLHSENSNGFTNGHQRFNSSFNPQSPMTQPMMADHTNMTRIQLIPADVPVESFKAKNTPSVPSTHQPTTPVMIQNGSNRNGLDANGLGLEPGYPNIQVPLLRLALERQALASNQQHAMKPEEAQEFKLQHDRSRAQSASSQGQSVGATGQVNAPPMGPGGPNPGNMRMNIPQPLLSNQQEISAKIFKRNLGNAGVMRILDLIDLISCEPHGSLSNVDFWARLFETYVTPTAIVRIHLPSEEQKPLENKTEMGAGLPENGANVYHLNMATAPSFFVTAVQASEVTKYQISLPGIKFQVLNNGSVFLASLYSNSFTYIDGSVGVASGECRILLNRDFRIGLIDVRITKYESTISIRGLKNLWSEHQQETLGGQPNFMSKVLAETRSEQTTKGAGLNDNAMRILRMSDVMYQLSPLMNFGMANNINSPLRALKKYVSMGGQNGPNAQNRAPNSGTNSSPSPKTLTAEDVKATKKRRVSNATNSPMSLGPIPEQKRS